MPVHPTWKMTEQNDASSPLGSPFGQSPSVIVDKGFFFPTGFPH